MIGAAAAWIVDSGTVSDSPAGTDGQATPENLAGESNGKGSMPGSRIKDGPGGIHCVVFALLRMFVFHCGASASNARPVPDGIRLRITAVLSVSNPQLARQLVAAPGAWCRRSGSASRD